MKFYYSVKNGDKLYRQMRGGKMTIITVMHCKNMLEVR